MVVGIDGVDMHSLAAFDRELTFPGRKSGKYLVNPIGGKYRIERRRSPDGILRIKAMNRRFVGLPAGPHGQR